MFACFYAPPRGLGLPRRRWCARQCPASDTGHQVRHQPARASGARVFPAHRDSMATNLVVLDTTGLTSMFGDVRELGATLRRSAADRGLYLRIAVASTRTAALLVVQERSGLTVIESGREAVTLASLSLERTEGAGAGAGAGHRHTGASWHPGEGHRTGHPRLRLAVHGAPLGGQHSRRSGALALGRAVRTAGCGWADLAAVCPWRGRGSARAGAGRGAIRVVAGARVAGRGARAAVLRVEAGCSTSCARGSIAPVSGLR